MQKGGLEERVVEFARLLRENGIRCTVAESIDAALAASLVGMEDLERLKQALRAALAKDPGRHRLFDYLFDVYWRGAWTAVQVPGRRIAVRVEVEPGSPVERFLSIYSPVEASWGEPGVEPPSAAQARALYRSLALLRRRLGLEEGRRRVPRRRGRIDFKRSMRRSLRTFGETVRLVRASRKRSKTDILVLLDVSNSMKDYWPWILGILNALRRLPPGSYEAFLFSTRLVRATPMVEAAGGAEDLRRLLSRVEGLWGSGTRISQSVEELLESHTPALHRGAAVLVFSDGWDLGDLGRLASALAELRRRAGFLVWVTPESPRRDAGGEPSTMRIIRRHADLTIDLETLLNTRRLLRLLPRSSA
ncbi:CoxE homolog [Aeropyrum pernix K1]|uniref:CoxE homolog n=1 Tax=Aeropyrum pernix (strain ATCC 700893 / DSM 11879 / JCM 9820 / NBRC 100138 / K1) TaxID=272557 RepID=Q9Y9R7_AERPE|nr:VWA domain-containing protein [Aeropyrum pernix]BAA81233.2 CoxE homolog [Aeropyrum pernix K1]